MEITVLTSGNLGSVSYQSFRQVMSQSHGVAKFKADFFRDGRIIVGHRGRWYFWTA